MISSPTTRLRSLQSKKSSFHKELFFISLSIHPCRRRVFLFSQPKSCLAPQSLPISSNRHTIRSILSKQSLSSKLSSSNTALILSRNNILFQKAFQYLTPYSFSPLALLLHSQELFAIASQKNISFLFVGIISP